MVKKESTRRRAFLMPGISRWFKNTSKVSMNGNDHMVESNRMIATRAESVRV